MQTQIEDQFPGVQVHNNGAQLTIHVDWQRMVGFIMLAATLIVPSAYFFVTTSYERRLELYGLDDQLNWPIVLAVVIPFVAALIFGIVQIVNRTQITANSTQVEILSVPFRFSGPKVIKVSDIANFAVEKNISSMPSGNGNSHVTVVNQVVIVKKDGNAIKVCNTRGVRESRFIEKQLESFLKIENDPNFDDV